MYIDNNWRSVARAIKRAILGNTNENLGGRNFYLTYDARTLQQEDDYPHLLGLAHGKKCIFDVGANIGRTSLLMSTALSQGGEIIAFEASEFTSRILLENIYLNGLDQQISAVNSLVAGTSGDVLDFYWEYSSGGASAIPGYLGHNLNMKKATLALDDYVRFTGKQPDFIKIDVEGAEAQVLNGMHSILASFHPLVAVEIHSWKSCTLPENAKNIVAIFQSFGYSLREMISDSPVTLESIAKWQGFRRFVVAKFEN
jgi:FkbM family methyltransferase